MKCKYIPSSNMFVYVFLIITFLFSSSQAVTNSVVGSSITNANPNEESNLQTYIVFVKKPNGSATPQPEDLDNWYRSFLTATTTSTNNQRLIYSYFNVATGFAAKLTAEEAKTMEEKDGFVAAYPERILTVQTTHTPAFLGLQQGSGLWNLSNYGEGLIIALMDTGVTPEHPSFSGEGIPPPPAKWKGKCDFNAKLCSNKIIGARTFVNQTKSPLDDHGHGTHTASTAAGRPVPGADYLGQYNGTATGMAPSAHLAIYKVCDAFGYCKESDILAGMDTAIDDGVDIISLSLGLGSLPFYNDPIALGAFSAIQKGMFVSCAAANYGPSSSTLSNEAPWILTVGASTVDRNIRATVLLGNSKEFDGQSFYQPSNFSSNLLPLVYPGAQNESSIYCEPGSLSNLEVKGKVVLCKLGITDDVTKGQVVKDAGGAAMIIMNDQNLGNYTVAKMHVLPASRVTYDAGLSIEAYINSTSSPMATILFKGTVFGVPYAPQLAYFSSRGPSRASPGILKPDIIGPGVDILAAWPPSFPPSTTQAMTMSAYATFDILSGTSMACPHLAGTAALIKNTHPDWSPAAIKSAIMTTASILNLGGDPITDIDFKPMNVFSIGAGHVNPPKANDPGLIYDTQPDDYIPYLCGLNYTDQQVENIVQRAVTCSNISSIPEAQLNYPSFSIRLGFTSQTYTRTVTNVGLAMSNYSSKVISPPGVTVQVTPNTLSFNEINQKATYTVTFSKTQTANNSFAQGYLIWVSDQHTVRSPLAVLFDA